MKKALILILCLILSASFITACGQKEEAQEPVPIDETIVGRWVEDYWDSGYVFNAEGTGEDIFWGQTFHFTTQDGRLTIKYDEGTWADKVFSYSVNGNILSLTGEEDGSEAGTWEYHKAE